MIRGGCLCGGIRFEIRRADGPFELCHCNRCRKVSGSAFVAGLRVRHDDFRLIQGQELVKTFEAPILEAPPAYCTYFCSRCGSPVPNPSPDASWFVPGGTLDDDPNLRPDKHIYVELKAPWYSIADDLPQFTKRQIRAYRRTHVQGTA